MTGAPFAFLALCLPALAAAGVQCPSDRVDEAAAIAYIYDGDTVRLDDGRKLRLIGINTPERGYDGEPSEPYAEAARDALLQLLDGQEKVSLRIGAERRDRYGRLLAHLFLADGASVAEKLLEQGLAATVVYPPNTWGHECYAAVEAQARGRQAGIWTLPRYQAVASTALGRDDEGYRIVRGRVERIGHSRKSVWLNLAGKVALRIPRKDLEYFTDFDPSQLEGRQVIARGWLRYYKKQLTMTVRHPAALSISP